MPNLPNMPNLQNLQNLELPRFNPYEMVQALSRSLSPMRYYMEGLDVSDIERMSGAAPRPPLARRSYSEVPAGSPDESPEEKRPRTSVDLSAASSRFWGDDGAAVVSDDGEEMVGSGSEEDDDDDDDDDDSDDDDAGDDDGEEEDLEDRLQIFGHR
jgi:hypothetical protein